MRPRPHEHESQPRAYQIVDEHCPPCRRAHSLEELHAVCLIQMVQKQRRVNRVVIGGQRILKRIELKECRRSDSATLGGGLRMIDRERAQIAAMCLELDTATSGELCEPQDDVAAAASDVEHADRLGASEHTGRFEPAPQDAGRVAHHVAAPQALERLMMQPFVESRLVHHLGPPISPRERIHRSRLLC